MSGHDKEQQQDQRTLHSWWIYGDEARAEQEAGKYLGFASGARLSSDPHTPDSLIGGKAVPLGYVYLKAEEFSKINATGGFAGAIPFVAGTGGSFPLDIQKGAKASHAAPLKDKDTTHEATFPALEFGVNLEPMDGNIPDVGERGLVVRGTKFGTTANNLWYSMDFKRSGNVVIISHHTSPNAPNNSTDVFDPDGDSSRFAGLDKAMTVFAQVGGCGGGDPDKFTLALNLAEDTGQAGIATFIESDATVQGAKETRAEQATKTGVAAFLQKAHKGPLTAGDPKADKHKIGTNKDGININSAHITTEAFYFMDKVFDGPINFEPAAYPPSSDGIVPRKVHRHFDPSAPHAGPCGIVFGKWLEYIKELFFTFEPGPPITPEPEIITPKELRTPSIEGYPAMQKVPYGGDPGTGGGDGGGEGGGGSAGGQPTVNGQDISEWLKGIQGQIESEIAYGMTPDDAYDKVMSNTEMHPEHERVLNDDMASSGYTLRGMMRTPVTWHDSTFGRKKSDGTYDMTVESAFVPSMILSRPMERKTGTADGVKMFAAYDLSKADMKTGATDRPTVSDISQATFGIDKDATLAFGSISADEGEVVDGFHFRMGDHPVGGAAYQALLMGCVDSDGAHDSGKAYQFENPVYDQSGVEILGGGGGSGDVVGPASAVDGNLSAYDGITGKLIKDSLIAIGNVALLDGTLPFTGNLTVDADLYVTGKLTVDGIIDPPGLELTPVAANPNPAAGGVAANTLWQDSTSSLFYRDGFLLEDPTRVIRVGSQRNYTTIAAGLAAAVLLSPSTTTPVFVVCDDELFNLASATTVTVSINIRLVLGGRGTGAIVFNSTNTNIPLFTMSGANSIIQNGLLFGQSGASGEGIAMSGGNTLLPNEIIDVRMFNVTTGVHITGGFGWIKGGDFQSVSVIAEADTGTALYVWDLFIDSDSWTETGTGLIRRQFGTNDSSGIPHLHTQHGYVSVGDDGWVQHTEQASTPAAPPANEIRVYAEDVAGTTHLKAKDSAGTVTDFMTAGDVTAAANMGNDEIVKGNGGAKGVQDSALFVADAASSKIRIHTNHQTDIEIVPNPTGFTVVGTGKNVLLDGGAGTVANGTASVGITNADAVNIGRSAITTTINGTVAAEGLQHVYFQSHNSAAQTGITTDTRIELDTEDHNSHGSTYSLDTVTNIGRLTINTAGTYRVTCDFEFESNDGTRSEFIGRLFKNGTLLTGAEVRTYHRTTAQDETGATINYIVTMAATDYLEMMVDDRNGGAATVALRNRMIVERLA